MRGLLVRHEQSGAPYCACLRRRGWTGAGRSVLRLPQAQGLDGVVLLCYDTFLNKEEP